MSFINIPTDILYEIIAKADPLEWKVINEAFSSSQANTLPIDWQQVMRMAIIPNLFHLTVSAVRAGDTFLLDLLLRYCNVDQDTINWALVHASEKGRYEMVKLLLSVGADPSTGDNSAIQLAAQNGHIEVFKFLITDPRVDPSADDSYAVMMVCQNGHVDMYKLLIQDPRVDPSTRNNRPIILAAHYGYLELVKLLLQDPRIDPTAQDNSALNRAQDRGHTDVANLLLSDPRVIALTIFAPTGNGV